VREILCVAGTNDVVVRVPVTILVEVPIVDVPLAVVGVPVDVHDEDSVSRAILSTVLRILSGLYRVRDLEVLKPKTPTHNIF
jgi:hypothetical protein